MHTNMLSAFVRFLTILFITVSLLIFFFASFSCPLSFNISSFDSETCKNIKFEEDAAPSGKGDIELTTIRKRDRVGRFTYAQPLHLWDSATGALTDFSTRFSFTIDQENRTNYGYGFAFYMAPVGFPIPTDSQAGFLGLFNESTIGEVSEKGIVMVEFDTNSNSTYDPPGGDPHVGINKNSLRSLSYTYFDIDSNQGKRGYALITYNATTKYLTVYWTFNTSLTDRLPNTTLSLKIDLMEALPELVTVGFSASTGLAKERHVIHSWEISPALNLTLPTTSRGEEKRSKDVVIVSVTCSLSLVLIAACVSWYLIRRRRSKQQDGNSKNCMDFDLKEAILRRFHYRELVAATNGFADNRKLGQGGSGQVYKGVLNNLGLEVAIKRMSNEFGNCQRIFINEVKIMSHLIHLNMVQLIGWCHEQGEFLLVFEYMPYGSLDTHIFRHREILPWNVRYKIVLKVVISVHYLHEEAQQCVLHRDIKSANILLDLDFNTKLCDFGIAKLLSSKIRTQNTGLVGTIGYLAPEYINGGIATKESDIYSFGVVILEIACGSRTYQKGKYHITLVKWVWQLHMEGNILKAADERLNMQFDVDEMKCLLTMGLWCTHPIDKERPNASQIIKVLQEESPLPQLPEDMYDFASHINTIKGKSNSIPSSPITTSLINVGR